MGYHGCPRGTPVRNVLERNQGSSAREPIQKNVFEPWTEWCLVSYGGRMFEAQRIAVYIHNEEHIYHIQGQICAYIYYIYI